MAKGRQPQLSLDDLRDWLESYSRKRSGVAGAPLRATEQFGRGVKMAGDQAYEFTSPLTLEETERLFQRGPDRGHAASLALYAALFGLTGPLGKATKKAGQGTKRLISGTIGK